MLAFILPAAAMQLFLELRPHLISGKDSPRKPALNVVFTCSSNEEIDPPQDGPSTQGAGELGVLEGLRLEKEKGPSGTKTLCKYPASHPAERVGPKGQEKERASKKAN